MSSPSDLQRRMFEAWNARDFETIRAALHPDYRYTGGDGKTIAGPDAGVAISQGYAAAFPDGKLEIVKAHDSGNTGITEMVARGTHQGELMGIAPSGRAVEILICNVAEIRDGKIYHEREYIDMLALMAQIGGVTLPAAAASA